MRFEQNLDFIVGTQYRPLQRWSLCRFHLTLRGLECSDLDRSHLHDTYMECILECGLRRGVTRFRYAKAASAGSYRRIDSKSPWPNGTMPIILAVEVVSGGCDKQCSLSVRKRTFRSFGAECCTNDMAFTWTRCHVVPCHISGHSPVNLVQLSLHLHEQPRSLVTRRETSIRAMPR